MQCTYKSTGEYSCSEHFTKSSQNKYNVLSGIIYYGNTLPYDNPVRKPSDCLENCNITPGCKDLL
jgi:hypothetical protein